MTIASWAKGRIMTPRMIPSWVLKEGRKGHEWGITVRACYPARQINTPPLGSMALIILRDGRTSMTQSKHKKPPEKLGHPGALR